MSDDWKFVFGVFAAVAVLATLVFGLSTIDQARFQRIRMEAVSHGCLVLDEHIYCMEGAK